MGIEKIVGLDKMTINQCQKLAEDTGMTVFDFVGPKGKKTAKWLDAYMGFFQIEGEKGFIMISQVQFVQNLWCENLRVE